MTDFQYLAISFTLKSGYRVPNSSLYKDETIQYSNYYTDSTDSAFKEDTHLKELLNQRSVTITKHYTPFSTDSRRHYFLACNDNFEHYHGLIEISADKCFDEDPVLKKLETYCFSFKRQIISEPIRFLIYFEIPPNQVIFRNALPNSNFYSLWFEINDLIKRLEGNTIKVSTAVKLEAFKMETEKKNAELEVTEFRKLIREKRIRCVWEITKFYDDNPKYMKLYLSKNCWKHFYKAMEMESYFFTDRSILELAKECPNNNKCLTPEESLDVIENWCNFQNISCIQFISNVIDILDRKTPQNTLYFHGDKFSGKTYITRSIQEAAFFYEDIKGPMTKVKWQYYVHKRLLIINNPIVNKRSIYHFRCVLEGKSFHVYNQRDDVSRYFSRTPVILISNYSHDLKSIFEEEKYIMYDKLKSCHFLKDQKDLHPQWLNLMASKYL